MDIKITDKSKNQKEINVTLSSEKVYSYADKAAKIISSENSIDGFRPGMAPKEIVEEKMGKERLWQESCHEALKDSYSQIVKKNNFLTVTPPEIKIESMEIDKPFTYKVTITTLPEIQLPDYKKIAKEIAKEKKEIETKQEEVDGALTSIQKSRAKIKSVTRTSQKGDELVIDFQGSVGGVKQEGLKAEKTNFILGEQKFIEGFEDQLVGLKEGDSKDFSLQIDLPSQTNEKKEKKNVDFSVKIHSVKEREIPSLDDEFAKSLGNFSNLDDLKQKIKENIKFEKDHKEKERIRLKIVESIGEKTSTEIPETMTARELDNMISEFKDQLSHAGLSFDDYLEKMGKNEEEIKKEWKPKAEKRILTGLVLQEIAKKENIEVKKEEVDQETEAYLNRLPDKNNPPDSEKLKSYIKDIIQNEKVFKLLEE